jgi:hypothetical protein
MGQRNVSRQHPRLCPLDIVWMIHYQRDLCRCNPWSNLRKESIYSMDRRLHLLCICLEWQRPILSMGSRQQLDQRKL